MFLSIHWYQVKESPFTAFIAQAPLAVAVSSFPAVPLVVTAAVVYRSLVGPVVALADQVAA